MIFKLKIKKRALKFIEKLSKKDEIWHFLTIFVLLLLGFNLYARASCGKYLTLHHGALSVSLSWSIFGLRKLWRFYPWKMSNIHQEIKHHN